jgi:hypothetical protein
VIEGTPSSGLHFAHADGTVYGALPSAPDVSLRDKVFRALRGLGFNERDAKRALERASAEVKRDADVEDLLRCAIGLVPKPTRRSQVSAMRRRRWLAPPQPTNKTKSKKWRAVACAEDQLVGFTVSRNW